MVGLKERETKKKRGGKGVVFESEPQNRPRLRVRKHTQSDPKITQYENCRISVGKPDKSA